MKTLLVCLGVCLFVRLYLIKIKTAEPIGPKFFVGPHVDPREGFCMIKFSKIASNNLNYPPNAVLLCNLYYVTYIFSEKDLVSLQAKHEKDDES